MTRPKHRRTLRLERLETREVLSGPTADQAGMLALVNLARTDPAQAAQRFTSKLDANVTATLSYYNVNLNEVKDKIASSPAQPPLAWNDKIGDAAQGQSQYQADAGVQSHSGAGGSGLTDRLTQAGYKDIKSSGEDIYAYSTSAEEAMQAFLIDWGVASDGHRLNIQQPGTSPQDAYKDAGVGIVNTNGKVGPKVVTVDFASAPDEQAQLFGFAYNDNNGNNFYEPGEGQSGITVQVTNGATGATAQTQTQDAGYYSISLAPGNYQVTASRNGQALQTRDVTVGNVNVEVDYNLSQLSASAPATFAAAAQTIATPPPPPVSAPPAPPSNPAPPLNTVTIPQNTVTIPQAAPTSSVPTVSAAFSKMFGTGSQFTLTSWGAGS